MECGEADRRLASNLLLPQPTTTTSHKLTHQTVYVVANHFGEDTPDNKGIYPIELHSDRICFTLAKFHRCFTQLIRHRPT
ncbi:hypothetical protein KIN20_001184 [Parelaphostrongylus tenuis]|uniref:Uncharacterized protein n=1 Tax=Parelaphostrongylus tenuis TaxID=148309 RepID=A0AAD5QGS3_PARTN|nr:hypothetical protein KIN20_001184 [Parelaphostrongylus tenuis]